MGLSSARAFWKASSPQGSQFTGHEWQDFLRDHHLISSMSRRGNCLDNAAMESWFSTLKHELGEHFDSPADAKTKLFDYIEVFYNRKRQHSTLGYKSPVQFLENWIREQHQEKLVA